MLPVYQIVLSRLAMFHVTSKGVGNASVEKIFTEGFYRALFPFKLYHSSTDGSLDQQT